MAIIVKWHPFKGGNACSCSDDIAQGSFCSYWCVHGVLDLIGSCEICIKWGVLLKHCSSFIFSGFPVLYSTVKLYGEGGWAATGHRKAVPLVLPVESEVWAVGLFGKPFGRSLCGPRVLKLLRDGVMVCCVLLPQVLTPSKYTLILPLLPLACVTLREVAHTGRPQSWLADRIRITMLCGFCRPD